MKEIKLFKLGRIFKKQGGIYTHYKIKFVNEESGSISYQFYSMHYTMQSDSYIHKLHLNAENDVNFVLPRLSYQYETIGDWEEDVEEEFYEYDDEIKSTFYIYENKKEFERDMALS